MKALRNLLRRVLNLSNEQVRSANEPFPTGDQPFLMVYLAQSNPVGMAKLEFNGDEEIEIIRTSFVSLVNIHFYGTGAYSMALRLHALIQSSFSQAELKKMNAALLTVSEITELSGLEGAGYEERAKLDLQLTHGHITTVPLARIKQVPLSVGTENYRDQTIIKE